MCIHPKRAPVQVLKAKVCNISRTIKWLLFILRGRGRGRGSKLTCDRFSYASRRWQTEDSTGDWRLEIGLLGCVRFGLSENCRSRTRFPRMKTVFLPPQYYATVPINWYTIPSLKVLRIQLTYLLFSYLCRWRGLDVLDPQWVTKNYVRYWRRDKNIARRKFFFLHFILDPSGLKLLAVYEIIALWDHSAIKH